MAEITYTRCGDYEIPNLKLSQPTNQPIGKYGRMRKRYLQEYRPVLFNCLLLSERLYPHLLELDEAAHRRMDTLMPQLMRAVGVNEQLKADDPMKWVGLMNELKTQAEKNIVSELVFVCYGTTKKSNTDNCIGMGQTIIVSQFIKSNLA